MNTKEIISKKRGKIFRKHQTSHETPFLRYHQSILNKIMHFDFKMDFTKKTKLKLNRRESNRKSKLEKRKKIIWAKKSLSKMRSWPHITLLYKRLYFCAPNKTKYCTHKMVKLLEAWYIPAGKKCMHDHGKSDNVYNFTSST